MSNDTIRIAGLAVIALWLVVQVILFWSIRRKALSSDLGKRYALHSTVIFLGGFATSMLMLD